MDTSIFILLVMWTWVSWNVWCGLQGWKKRFEFVRRREQRFKRYKQTLRRHLVNNLKSLDSN